MIASALIEPIRVVIKKLEVIIFPGSFPIHTWKKNRVDNFDDANSSGGGSSYSIFIFTTLIYFEMLSCKIGQ